MYPINLLKHNKTLDTQVNFLMIIDGENNWHYLAIKSIPTLLHGLASNHKGDYYCLNCFHSYRTLNALKNHDKICEDDDYCDVKMPNDDNKYLSSTSGKNCLRVLIVVYADFECLLSKMNSCENCPDKSYTEKKRKHIPCGYSITTCYSYNQTLNKSAYYRGPDCVENVSQELKKILSDNMYFEEKPMLPLTDNEKTLYINEKSCYICEKEFFTDKKSIDYKNYCKVRDHCYFTGKYRGIAHSKCNLKYKVPKDIPVSFHNGSIYDNHLIIKQISKDLNGCFTGTGENTEKYIKGYKRILVIRKKDLKHIG